MRQPSSQAVLARTTTTHWGEPTGFTYHVTDPAKGNKMTVCGLSVEFGFPLVLDDPYRPGRVTCKRCLRALPNRLDISAADD